MNYTSMGGIALVIALSAAEANAQTYAFSGEEAAYDQLYLNTAIQLVGRIVDERGAPVRGAVVSLIAWGENADNHGISRITGPDGRFSFNRLHRRNAILRTELPGYYQELVPVELQRPLGERAVDIGDIALVVTMPGRTRLTFGGDTMIARRFLDHDGDGMEGEPPDIIQPGSIAENTADLFRFVRDVLLVDDHTSVNLETAVTGDLSTPHPTKSHVFHTYPDSVSVFPAAGIDSVSIGNNHVYDYLEIGIANTLAALADHGMPFYGGGTSETEARSNLHHEATFGFEVVLQGFEEQIGTNYGSDSLHIVAKDSPIIKGGALWLSTPTLAEFVTGQGPDAFPVPVFHGGTEYVYVQPSEMRDRFREAIDLGAGMVVANHPHYAQGVGVYDPGTGPRYIFNSLGNFVFDMGYFETLRSYLAVVDIDYSPAGPVVSRVRLIPFRLDDYVPRLLVGSALTRMGRHIAHLSTAEGGFGDGILGATVVTEAGRIAVGRDPSEFAVSEMVNTRELALSSDQSGIFEFEAFAPSDSLARLVSDLPATCELGRDILIVGDFEDRDVDDAWQEGDRWSTSEACLVQNSVTRSGTNAAVILRDSSDTVEETLWMYNRIKVTPGGAMTVTGFHRGKNAGTLEIAVRWRTASGGTISNTVEYTAAPGDYDWSHFTIDLSVPTSADAMNLYFHAYPPQSGEARTYLDDVAVVEWQAQTGDLVAGEDFATPNDWSYLRCQALGGGADAIRLAVLHRVYESL